ncbi:putative uncharacterized protein [Eggerthella sp. CAG:1427]|nr:putative uncharacterized protein [Eggerthella sp. CAG:1427]
MRDKICFAEYLVADDTQIAVLVVVDADEDNPVVTQQLTSQPKPRIHHGAPIAVETPARVDVGLVGQSRLFLVVLDGIAELVLVDKVVAGVIRRIDIDHLDLAVVAALQELQDLEVVTFDVDVVGVEAAILAVSPAALLHAGAERGGARSLRLANGIGLAGPSERVALLTLVHLITQLQTELVEIDAAFGEYLGHQFLELRKTVIHQILGPKVHALNVIHCKPP